VRRVSPAARSLPEALALGPALLACARAERRAWIGASLVEGPAVVLGASQRAGRVVDLAACAAAGVAVLRRATTGTAVYLGRRGVVWTLALPHFAALAPDATARTLLNRNVRGFLKGFTRAGALAHYFGREWISVRGRPAAVLGVDAAPDGAALLEVWAGHDAPPGLPPALATEDERSVDRWLGKQPAALAEVLPPGASLEELSRAVIDGVAQRAPAPIEEAAAPALDVSGYPPIRDPLDPLPAGYAPASLERVPIGWIESARGPADAAVWIGSDALSSRWILEAIARDAEAALDPEALALDGAAALDLRGLARRARRA
jgi:hypothetical protein